MSLYVGYRGKVRWGGPETVFNESRAGDYASFLSRAFGYGETIGQLGISRRSEAVRTLGSRFIELFVGGEERHSVGVSFYPESDRVLDLFFAQPDTNGVRSVLETVKSYAVGVQLGSPFTADRVVLVFTGAVPSSLEISGESGRAVRASVQFSASGLEMYWGASELPDDQLSGVLFATWAPGSYVSVKLSDGSVFTGVVRRFTLSIGESVGQVYGVGSRRPVNYYVGPFTARLSVGALFERGVLGDYVEQRDLQGVELGLAAIPVSGEGGQVPSGAVKTLVFRLEGPMRVTSASPSVRVVEPAELSFTVEASRISVVVEKQA